MKHLFYNQIPASERGFLCFGYRSAYSWTMTAFNEWLYLKYVKKLGNSDFYPYFCKVIATFSQVTVYEKNVYAICA